MTVRELIEKLNAIDPDTQVMVATEVAHGDNVQSEDDITGVVVTRSKLGTRQWAHIVIASAA